MIRFRYDLSVPQRCGDLVRLCNFFWLQHYCCSISWCLQFGHHAPSLCNFNNWCCWILRKPLGVACCHNDGLPIEHFGHVCYEIVNYVCDCHVLIPQSVWLSCGLCCCCLLRQRVAGWTVRSWRIQLTLWFSFFYDHFAALELSGLINKSLHHLIQFSAPSLHPQNCLAFNNLNHLLTHNLFYLYSSRMLTQIQINFPNLRNDNAKEKSFLKYEINK